MPRRKRVKFVGEDGEEGRIYNPIELTLISLFGDAFFAALEQMGAAAKDAFRPASECLGRGAETYSALLATLKREKWIRHRTVGRRRFVHMGDWSRFQQQWRSAEFDNIDTGSVAGAFLAEVQDRLAQQDRRRNPGSRKQSY
jgi:hypothetical protein